MRERKLVGIAERPWRPGARYVTAGDGWCVSADSHDGLTVLAVYRFTGDIDGSVVRHPEHDGIVFGSWEDASRYAYKVGILLMLCDEP